MIPGPDGVLMPKKAAEKAWEIHNRRVQDQNNIEVGNKRRASRLRGRDMERDQDEKDRTVKQGRVAARWGKLAARLAGFAERLRNDLPLFATLVTVAAGLTVTLAGQVMFYSTLPWPPLFVWLIIPMAALVESGSWTYGIHARWLADQDLPYGKQIRRMWLLALLAAGMNTYHGATAFPGHLEMGVILGGGSILSPMAWHGYVYLTKSKGQGRTGVQIRAAAGRRINHPVLTRRAWDLRSSLGGRITPEVAFLMVYRERFGYLPGQRPAGARRAQRRVVGVQVRWSPAGAVTVPGAPLGAPGSGESSARVSGGASAPVAPPSVVTSADNRPSDPLALALVGGDSSNPDLVLTDLEIEQFLASLPDENQQPDRALGNTQTGTSGGVSGSSAERSASAPVSVDRAVAQTAPPALDGAPQQRSGERRPTGSAGRRRAAKSATAEDRVRAEVERRVTGGQVLASITGAEVAKALKIGESTARRFLAKINQEVSGQSS